MRDWSGFKPPRRVLFLLSVGLLLWLFPESVWAADNHTAFLSSISISILAATVLAYFATLIKQPLILAYIAAGMAIGPQIGFAWVQNKSDIQTIAEIGLILLLFMIGLELDLRKLKESGRSLIVTGVFQFIICVLLGLGFFLLLGFSLLGQAPFTYKILGVQVLGGPYDLLYLAACISLSSTAIVVKLLYEKFELDTLAGRFTLGVLVFQDLWAIVLLSIQPNLAQPQATVILLSFAKGALLVLVSFLVSRYVLGYIFRGIAKLPEIMLVASLGWCFLIAGLADHLGLSMEMGALIAGVALSTFPHNLDIIGKIINIRDFFIVLFFVALGMVIPNPLHKPGLLLIACVTAGFLVLTRFLSVYPLLYGLGNGNRVSLLASINLSQISEFALVIVVIGNKPENRHIGPDIVTLIIFVFVLTSIASTYMIKYNQGLQNLLRKGVEKLGFRSLTEATREDRQAAPAEIALLGFYRVASAFIAEMESLKPHLKEKLVVVDFNPDVFRGLRARGIKVVYGDISNEQTLHHANIEESKVVISTITDDILVGTSNMRLMNQIRRLSPQAQIVVTAGSASQALKLYEAGADYVLRPNKLTARHMLEVLERLLRDDVQDWTQKEIHQLRAERDILG
jgi:Kef-type K+ transport system membrane component KefB/Trk K+ transport system NAD-binding subunit